jgi:DNA-binding SARP family transcriptional activator
VDGDSLALHIQLLGPVRAWRGGRELRAGPAGRRAVLAMLASTGGRPVAAAQLARGLPGHPAGAGRVAAHVAALRRVLGEPAVTEVTRAAGGPAYLLRLGPDGLDTARMDADLAAARRDCAHGQLPGAARVLDRALARFRGEPLHAVPGPWAAAERQRLAEIRLAILEERIEVMLALGRYTEAVPLLSGLARQHPQRERFLGQLMVALYRSGCRAEALARFDAARQNPAGAPAPGPGLRRLQLQILTGDTALLTVLPPGGGLPTGGGLPAGPGGSGAPVVPRAAMGPGSRRDSALSREAAAADRWRRSAARPHVSRAAR